MLLSICILFCDKDYHYIDGLLKNIKEKVEVDHEVILIDNRKDKSIKLEFENVSVYPCDKLGQFNGRRLAISKTNGDYIWFVDADDTINRVPSYLNEEMSQRYDIITFNAQDSFGDWTGTWPTRDENSRHRIITRDNLLTYDVEVFVGPCVWNKFFKRNVLLESLSLEDEYLTYNEDALFNMIALKNSRVIKSLDILLYNYNSEASQAACKKLDDFSKFENLISSGLNLFKIREKLFKGQDKIETDKWLPKPLCIQFFNHRIYHSIPELQIKEMKLLCETYGANEVLDAIYKHAICEIQKEEKSREEIIAYLVEIWEKAQNKNKSLSVCFNFCDKDFKYVPNLINNIKKYMKISDYEIIVCDNRTDENGKDEYIEGVKIWPTGGNLGPLGGRKEALKHITKDYVWYLDADDLINCEIGEDCQKVLNLGNDYIAFKAIDDENKTSGIWADTTLYDNKEIRDEFFFSYRTYVMSGATLWNKWVRTDIFKCILDIPDTTAVCYEDALCNSYIMKHSTNMYLYNAYLYKYRSNLGDANRSNIRELDSFKRTTNGGRTTLDLAKKLFTEDELFAMDAWFSDLRYLEFSLKRVVDSDVSIQEDEIRDLMKYFSVEDIATTFKYFTWYFDERKTQRAYKKFLRISNYKENNENHNYKLSISIAFFDKDLMRIHSLIKNIEDRIKFDKSKYEIILINNCLYNNKYIPMLNGYRVIPTGSLPEKNVGTYATRQLGVKNAKGDYIWFIDADDKIIDDITEEDLAYIEKGDYDFIVFNSERDNHYPTGMGQYIKEDFEISGETLLSNDTYSKAGPCLWNKWIRRSCLFSILNTPSFAINAFEDTLVSAVAEKNSKKALFRTKKLYQYNCSCSNTCSESIKSDDIKKIFLGKDKIESLKTYLFSERERVEIFSLSKAYSDNFFGSRLKKEVKDDSKKVCILSSKSHSVGFQVFSPSNSIESIKGFEYIFVNLNGNNISKLQIFNFKNCSFNGPQTVSQKELLKYNYLLSSDTFMKVINGKRVEVSADFRPNIFEM